MAKERRPAPSSTLASTPGGDWDEPYGPQVPDAPAGASMPPRAARLPSQNGPAMRNVFAYLLDEDPAPLPPPPPGKKRR